MSDLVERLRDADRYKRDTTVDDPPGIMAEAADEIERLVSRLCKIQSALYWSEKADCWMMDGDKADDLVFAKEQGDE